LKRKKTAAIFPAFGCEYLGREREIIGEFSDDWMSLLDRAASYVQLDTRMIVSCRKGDFMDELQSQYAVYLYSCAFSNVIKRYSIFTDYSAGYSMGLYAALYHAGSIDFEQGLDLIHAAYKHIKTATVRFEFGIGVISGLDQCDVSALISGFSDLEIINVNNRLSFLIGGFEKNVRKAVALAREQGALNAHFLSFNSPYHSKFMNGAARTFKMHLKSTVIRDPVHPVISTIDQRLIKSSADAINDLADNICRNINWLDTMTSMINSGVDTFIECGPGMSLYKMARFIEGEFSVYTADTIQELIGSNGIYPFAHAATN
jgi:[acyl-carrier-protein] S-malonyltransferase